MAEAGHGTGHTSDVLAEDSDRRTLSHMHNSGSLYSLRSERVDLHFTERSKGKVRKDSPHLVSWIPFTQ